MDDARSALVDPGHRAERTVGGEVVERVTQVGDAALGLRDEGVREPLPVVERRLRTVRPTRWATRQIRTMHGANAS
jgi:hypothetical protein